MLLTTDDFTGEFAIGQFQLNEPLLQDYINNHELEFFQKYFKCDYYEDLVQRMADSDTDVKEQAQAEFAKFKRALVAFVWTYYVSREQEKLTGAGITLQLDENAKPVNIDTQCRRVYNEMMFVLKECGNPNILHYKLLYRNCIGLW